MSSDISFKIVSTTPSKGEAQLPPFLTLVRNPEHVLRVQTEPRLPSPRERRQEKRKSVMLFLMATAIVAMAIPAMLGVDITAPSPAPTQVEAPKN